MGTKVSAGPGKSSAKWCHFAFETEDAPQALHRLSAAAGIPKERAALSFLLAGAMSNPQNSTKKNPAPPPEAGEIVPVRIISDPFPIPSGYGRYGCSGLGAILVEGTKQAMEKQPSGALLRLARKLPERRDPKSGALIMHCPDNYSLTI
jgi:hypothetical protein